MKTLTLPNRTLLLSGACAGLAIIAMGFAGNSHARDGAIFSVSVGVPTVLVGANNAYPVYSQPRPVYVQTSPVYVRPAPVYYQSVPVYYAAPPVYAVPQPVYHDSPKGWKHGHHKKYKKHFGHQHGYYSQGYAPVYYQR